MSSSFATYVGWYVKATPITVPYETSATSCPEGHPGANTPFCPHCGNKRVTFTTCVPMTLTLGHVLWVDDENGEWAEINAQDFHWLQRNAYQLESDEAPSDQEIVGVGGFFHGNGEFLTKEINPDVMKAPPLEDVERLVKIMRYSSYELAFGVVSYMKYD
jgi:hypothetical protein